jgi:hypothetical protein
LRVQPVEQVGLEATTFSQEHPSLLSLPPEGHSRTLSSKHTHASVRIPPWGHVGSALPMQSAECGVRTLPLGHVGLLVIPQVHVLGSILNPLGHIGLERLSHAHKPCGFTIGV